MKKKKSPSKGDTVTTSIPDSPAGNTARAGNVDTPCPIVGLGASAGGLEALKAFFDYVPAISCLAYIVVVHMTPTSPA